MNFNATFIVSIISFIVFVLIMNKILYKPILDIVEQRKNLIQDNYDTAKKNIEKSENLLKQKKDRITETKNSARNNYANSVSLLRQQKDEKIKQAENEIKKQTELQQQQIMDAKNEAQNALKGEIINLAQIISDKFLENKEEIDKNLVEEII